MNDDHAASPQAVRVTHEPAHDDHHHEHDDHAVEAPAMGATPEHGYWRSLRELTGKATLQTDRTGNEFATAPSRVIDPLHRRNFFQLMGASMALAGVGACRYEKEDIVPLARRPEGQVPGATIQYATAFELGGVGHALLATSFEGRPIKLDGNPEHPFASGGIVPGTERHAGTSAWVQAAILNLYDPDRSQNPMSGGKGATIAALKDLLRGLGQNLAGVRVLSEATSSPTVRFLRDALVSRGAGWHEYEPLSWDNERLGTKLAFGTPARPLARLDRCETIVTLDCDVFVEHPAAMRYSRDFAKSRRLGGSLGPAKMNRLWSIESTFSNTGAMADHRLPLRSELGLPFAMALEAAVAGGAVPASGFLKEKRVAEFVRVLASELKANTGRAVVIAGRRQPPEVHAVVAKINAAIGAVSNTLDYLVDPDADRPSHVASIASLAADMAGGKVQTLLMLGGNPVFDAPADVDFAGSLPKVKTSIHLHEYLNETSEKSTWHVPRAHFLEAWGDTCTWDGTVTIAQPLIAPLYGGLSSIDLLSMVVGETRSARDLLFAVHEKRGIQTQSVHDGFIPNTQQETAKVTANSIPAPVLNERQLGDTQRPKSGLEVVFHYSSFTYDGRFANNAWLQETPDFLTKVTWDNYALVGPETAEALGIANDEMIKVKVNDREVELPCYTIPGQARFSIALVLGGGRTAAGRVGGQGKRSVGWDTYKVRTTMGFDVAGNATVTGTGTQYELASVQEHWDIRTGLIPSVTQDGIAERLPDLIKEATAASVMAARASGKPLHAEPRDPYFIDDSLKGNTDPEGTGGKSLFKEKDYQGHRWAMAIDLSTCMGCNACHVACQAENNIPVVGRKEILNNREMSWIRIDRYFSGPPEDPRVVHQPVACQQCEQAPCEQVCPVGATTHSDEGLNDMAYNRCIGTRYCANNCPYKVRRFNFLDWNKEWREARNRVRRLVFNPEVTVRMRGVMEKCTFCVQRIQNAKIKAKAEIRSHQRPGTVTGPLADGEVTTACQAACPTEAIVFGDLMDPNSRVSKLHAESERAYALLPELYTKPRNKFLTRVRNPNPELVAPKSSADHGGH
ncbi:MAG: TAT-variant-translocated molybdopterin oxidoreductase [Kofleriaceae bacterium]